MSPTLPLIPGASTEIAFRLLQAVARLDPAVLAALLALVVGGRA